MSVKGLGEDYKHIRTVSFDELHSRRWLINLAVIAPSLFLMIIAAFSIHPHDGQWLILVLTILVIVLAYIPLHEFLHGIAFKIITGYKPKYVFRIREMSFYCDYNGVFLTGTDEIVCVAAPLVIIGVILALGIVCAFIMKSILVYVSAILSGVHLFSCRGDIYCIWVLVRLKGKDILVNDNGNQMVYMHEKKE